MISRVADGCFWLGRYLERAESMARLLATSRALALDGELTPLQVWWSVLVVADEDEELVARHGEGVRADGELVQSALTWDTATGSSIARSVQAARDNARSIREVLSGDVWEAVNELWLWMESPSARQEWGGTAISWRGSPSAAEVRAPAAWCASSVRSPPPATAHSCCETRTCVWSGRRGRWPAGGTPRPPRSTDVSPRTRRWCAPS